MMLFPREERFVMILCPHGEVLGFIEGWARMSQDSYTPTSQGAPPS